MSINENTTNLENILDDVNNISTAPVLLWTNPSPTSAFAEQTVSVNSGYAAYLIELRYITTKETNLTKSFINVGESLFCFATESRSYPASSFHRLVTANDGAVVFGKSYSAGVNNATAIPTRIWGVKFTL